MFFLFWGAGFNVLLGLRSGNYLGNLMKCWGRGTWRKTSLPGARGEVQAPDGWVQT